MSDGTVTTAAPDTSAFPKNTISLASRQSGKPPALSYNSFLIRQDTIVLLLIASC